MNEVVLELKSAAEWFAKHSRTEYSAIIGICNRAVEEINRLKAEIERLTTQLEQKIEMLANLGVKLISYEDENERLKTDLQAMRSAANSLKMHLEKYQDIESTVDEFWIGLQKMSIFKGKDKPTLEELLEYIEQKDEEIERLQKDKADIIDAVEYRINQAKEFAYKKFAEKLKRKQQEAYIRHCGYENDVVEVQEIDNLLAELTPEPLTKLPHSSLCETDTYEGDLKG